MPTTLNSPFAPGGSRIRRDLFGIASWKLWRKNPSTTEMLSAGRVFTRDDMTFDDRYVQAWLIECDKKLDRKKAEGKTVDSSLPQLRKQVIKSIEQKNERVAIPVLSNGVAVSASAPQ